MLHADWTGVVYIVDMLWIGGWSGVTKLRIKFDKRLLALGTCRGSVERIGRGVVDTWEYGRAGSAS